MASAKSSGLPAPAERLAVLSRRLYSYREVSHTGYGFLLASRDMDTRPNLYCESRCKAHFFHHEHNLDDCQDGEDNWCITCLSVSDSYKGGVHDS